MNADNKTNLNRVISYCENVVDCRRFLQLQVWHFYFCWCNLKCADPMLQYFGETFEVSKCKKTCDNCQQAGERVSKDISNDARCFAQIVKTLANGNVTLKQCLGILIQNFSLLLFLSFNICFHWKQ